MRKFIKVGDSMTTMKELATEYLANVVRMEQRIAELKAQMPKNGMGGECVRLRRRICDLQKMVNESRRTAYVLEHYYEKPNGDGVDSS